MMRTATAAAALALALSASGCAYNEDLGRSQFLLVDDRALAGASQQAWAETLSKSRVSRDSAANERVRRIATRIIDAAGLNDRPWEVVVFDNPQANAFVVPGGKMGVNTGLLRVVQNDDQLAAVIGHEVAHTVANHAAERYSQTAATQIALAGAQGVLGQSNPTLGRQVAAFGGAGAQLGVLMPFSRQHELEADRLGVDYMARAGFNPSQAIELWRLMGAQRTGGSAPQVLSTHPSDETRLEALARHIESRGYAVAAR